MLIMIALVFESHAQQPVWQLDENNGQLQTLQHSRLEGDRRTPSCDFLRFHAASGTYAYAVFPIKPTTVISELKNQQSIK